MRRLGLSIAFVVLFCGVSSAQDEGLPQWVKDYQREAAPKLMRDYGQLSVYREANTKLSEREAGRVVFIGDSITNSWDLSRDFPSKPYVNRGIGWQNTSQMLVRFREDVVDLHPVVVVILGGANDLSGAYGPVTVEQIEANYHSMADLARANGIAVAFGSVLPVHSYTTNAADTVAMHPPEKILALNNWLHDFCAANGYAYIDYFSALVDEKGFMKKDLAEDGLHPTAEAYKLMAPIAESAIKEARSLQKLRAEKIVTKPLTGRK